MSAFIIYKLAKRELVALLNLSKCAIIGSAKDVKSFEIGFKELEEIKAKFVQAHIDIESESKDFDEKNHYVEYDSFMSMYKEIKYVYYDIFSESKIANQQKGGNSLKLPILEIPKFSGKATEWINFNNLFKSMIDENCSLGNVQKMQYLVSLLDIEPLRLVKHLPLSPENYSVTYHILIERYENKRLIADAHIDHILNFSFNKNKENLRAFVDILKENTFGLDSLGFPVKEWPFLLLNIVLRKLSIDIRTKFELTVEHNTVPTFNELLKFLENHCGILEVLPTSNNSLTKHRNQATKVFVTGISSEENHHCICCSSKTNHPIYHCSKFLSLAPKERFELIKQYRLCINCLQRGHRLNLCKSKSSCKQCNGKHNSLLHFIPKITQPSDPSSPATDLPEPYVTASCLRQRARMVELLSTATIIVQGQAGKAHCLRALLDTASQSNFISLKACKLLGLNTYSKNVSIQGIGMSNNTIHTGASFTFYSKFNNRMTYQIDALVLDKITHCLPSCEVQTSFLEYLNHSQLADEKFGIPGEIDVLLGASVFAKLLRPGLVEGPTDLPIGINTVLGIVIMGSIPVIPKSESIKSNDVTLCVSSLEHHLHQFWEIEDIPNQHYQSEDDKTCEEVFKSQTYCNPLGRFVVPLLLKNDSNTLGSSEQNALLRFHRLERTLKFKPELQRDYIAFMREYETLGHMRELSMSEHSLTKYLIPHHCIIKPLSSTTKLRVVFDASSHTTSNKSLNDVVFVGPKLQSDIIHLICSFRMFKIAFTSDICKMYRQILIREEDRPYQRILWRESPDEPLKQYELNTVTYGVASSPFLAIRTLNELAVREKHNFPRASKIILQNVYLDDILSGGQTVDDALSIRNELISLLKLGCFEVRKWASNSQDFLSDLPEDHREVPLSLNLGSDGGIKILGIYWNPNSDSFTYQITSPEMIATKRNILSCVARIFDPLGWISPVIFVAKCLLQELWKLGLEWDDPTPDNIQTRWENLMSNLHNLAFLDIPRHLGNIQNCYLVGFSDASNLGYAAVVYCCSNIDTSNPEVRLLLAKTKVAPLKTLSIPRLELCASHLLSKLLSYTYNNYKDELPIDRTFAFTDSSIVLAWIKTPSYLLKTFVANRVSQISDKVPIDSWYHVISSDNPADLGSRGLSPTGIVDSLLWWNGPSWLSTPLEYWPIASNVNISMEDLPERKSPDIPTILVIQQNMEDFNIFYRYSSFTKLVNVTAWCCRFIRNCQLSSCKRNVNKHLNLCEITAARSVLIKYIQSICFRDEIIALNSSDKLKSSIRNLAPFLDDVGVIRVGGRLRHSNLTETAKHPILLPKNHVFTNLLIDHYHKIYLHIGSRTLQSVLSQQFWIVSARNTIRKRLRKCLTCFKANPRKIQPFMGDIPSSRFREGRAFLNVGIDYGGYFFCKESRRRGAKQLKTYLCLFVCLSTKAVHLELVSDLTTEAFLAALDRFVARRGICENLFSDCGTNFIGANKHLDELCKYLHTRECHDNLTQFMSIRNINWHFSPPSAPHFNGLMEAGIKSAKSVLRKVVGEQVLTFEELSTVFCRIEAILNSRPLSPLSTDPAEIDVLTPGHFLIGAPLVAVPELNAKDVPMNRLSRWQLLQQMAQHFWTRWRREYLHTLQNRAKWTDQSPNLQVGDLVLIDEANTRPMQWPRIIKCFPGPDSVVRVVDVQTSKKIVRRPVVKLFKLPN